MIKGGPKTESYLERFSPIGAESVELFFWERMPDEADLSWAEKTAEECRRRGLTVSCLGMYGNPLREDEAGRAAREGWSRLMEMAPLFETDLITGFTGRIPDRPVEESLEPLKRFFTPLLDRAAGGNLRLAFENCPMGGRWQCGDWNLAFCPESWYLIFRALQADHLGLEWDPSHSVLYGQPVLRQLREWGHRIFHVHGKDALPLPEESGVNGYLGSELPFEERFPGRGSLDWKQIFYELERLSYTGCVDLEGYHDAVYSPGREVRGQMVSLAYLRTCRDS